MKSLRFKSLQLLSEREKKGRSIGFHPNKNLIFGLNHVGKSTVTKQTFEALGASPVGKLQGWDNSAIALLTATLDEDEYHFLRQNSHRAVFNSQGELIASTATGGEWTKVFAQIMEFNLVLSDKNERTSQADAACMFLPFYINQDGGWSGIWRAFNGLSRFRSPATAIVEYFTQVVPPQFYVAKAESESEQRKITEIEADLRILNRTRERLSGSLDLAGPQVSAEGFEVEIKEITRQLTTLNAQQEALRAEAVTLQESLALVDHQIALTTAALKKFGDDFGYLSKPKREELICPTCGAHHEETFLSVLNFAEDARKLSDMLIRLQESRALHERRLAACVSDRRELAARYGDLQAVLEVRRGELKFSDVVRSMGSGAAFVAFDQEDRALEESRNKHLIEKHKQDQSMKAFRSAKRRKKIRQAFQEEYRMARIKLNLPSRDISKMNVSSRPDISGSGGPREVLAYYAALWRVSRSADFGIPFSLPIVVDCPAQSGQDPVNLPAILHFISTGLPADAQVLLTYELDVEEKFDQRIPLDVAYSVLLESEYDEVAGSVLPKMEMMNKALLQRARTDHPTLFGN
jgi:hypothetical protein